MRLITSLALLLVLGGARPLALAQAPETEAPPPPAEQPPLPWGPSVRIPKAAQEVLDSARVDFLRPHPEDDSKAIEGHSPKLNLRTKMKDCCGYPLGERSGFTITFYWLAWEAEYANEPYLVDIYTRSGFPIGRFPKTFVFELKMEGSALLRDGRAVNYDGRCRYGIGICFQTLDVTEHPLGKGGQGRPLEPFRSVAVDPRFVPLGTPMFVPELAGLRLPDGTTHDGCVRADDTGGNIRRRELDFFVESYANYKFLDEQFWGNNHVTPFVEEQRCDYLRRYNPAVDRRSEATDWTRLEAARPKPPSGKKSGSRSGAQKPAAKKPKKAAHLRGPRSGKAEKTG